MTNGQIMARKPKRLEEIAQRESVIVAAARRLMATRGFQGFTMDDVARAIDYAKGTLYLHFTSKEDMAVAIASQNLRRRAELLELAADRKAPSRECFMGLVLADEIFQQEAPDHFAWDHLLRQPSFWDRVSEPRQQEHRLLTQRCLGAVEKVMRQAIADGDLDCPPSRLRSLVLVFVSFDIGQRLMFAAPDLLLPSDELRSEPHLELGASILMDGMGWRPLGAEVSWPALRRKLLREFFHPHLQRPHA